MISHLSAHPAPEPDNSRADTARRPADVIIRRFEPWLQKTARAIAGTSSPHIEDLVQEGRLALWQALESYDPERGALAAWLVYKARYRMYELVQGRPWTGQPPRHHGRQGVAEPVHVLSLDATTSRDDSTGAPALAELVPDLRDDIEPAELAYHDAELSAAIANLTPQQRRYVEARFRDGMTTAEMKAEVFGYDPSALWNSRRNGAKYKLRAELAHLRDAAS